MGRQLHRRFEVKGEDSKWSNLSWSGRGVKDSSSLAATRLPKAKSTFILRCAGVVVSGSVVSCWMLDSWRVDHLFVIIFTPHLVSNSRPTPGFLPVLTTTIVLLGHTPQVLLHNMAEPGIGIPVSTVKEYKPYFIPQEIQELCEKTRGKMSVSQEEKTRQHACTFIGAIGAKIGL